MPISNKLIKYKDIILIFVFCKKTSVKLPMIFIHAISILAFCNNTTSVLLIFNLLSVGNNKQIILMTMKFVMLLNTVLVNTRLFYRSHGSYKSIL